MRSSIRADHSARGVPVPPARLAGGELRELGADLFERKSDALREHDESDAA